VLVVKFREPRVKVVEAKKRMAAAKIKGNSERDPR
jgi:hypothetical protein